MVGPLLDPLADNGAFLITAQLLHGSTAPGKKGKHLAEHRSDGERKVLLVIVLSRRGRFLALLGFPPILRASISEG